MSDKYPKPSVTADTIIFALDNGQVQVLLIQRKGEPFQGKWAIPGGFVEIDESLEVAASRELEEETGLTGVTLEQFQSFGDPRRDPRGRTITVSYLTFLPAIPNGIKGSDDAADARWFPINNLPELAFDHQEILRRAIKDLHIRLESVVQSSSYFSDDLKIGQLRTILKNIP
ncbi:MAG: NUDIX hydrolase [Acidobacteriota bacterium]